MKLLNMSLIEPDNNHVTVEQMVLIWFKELKDSVQRS